MGSDREIDPVSSSSEHLRKPVIVIGRQTGSGGRLIGKAVAKLLDVEYYDRELLKECAARHGYSDYIFESADERRPSMFRSLLAGYSAMNDASPLTGEGIYKAQSNVIRQIAEHSPAVFVGRTADYVLREHPRMFSVFLHAPEEWRVKKILQRGDSRTEAEALAILRKLDSRRQDYYNYFTRGGWGKAETYDICIDSSRFDPDFIAQMIVELASKARSR